jgi:nicotinate phosphoribosyltransferase
VTVKQYSPLLTDFYQLTMAYGYFQLGMHEQPANFHLIFRKNPFKGHYALCCGLGTVIDYLSDWHFEASDLDYLSTLKTPQGDSLFSQAFLDYLQNMTFTCNLDAIPEGTVVFANEPLIRIQGPILQCQLIETALLNMMNFQTLIATKASRVCEAAQGDAVIEFGMRRSQGPDGSVSASRAAYIGGCVATSNTIAGKLYQIPLRGTHAHSWVTAFPSELEAFQAYANIMPHHCTLLVDTYNTIEGVKNAIHVGKTLREEGHDLLAIRLDSGDMAALSIKARQLLDDAGFQNTIIMASNSLDEYAIKRLKEEGAKISAWGVGTNLATAYDHPALDGVYKLSALCDSNGQWQHKIKLSEQEVKVSNPGRHQVRRFFYNDRFLADVIYDLDLGISDSPTAIQITHPQQHLYLDDYDGYVDLLKPIILQGKLISHQEPISEIRANAIAAVKNFTAQDTHQHMVMLEEQLFNQKRALIEKLS